jgi:hypothetical protein
MASVDRLPVERLLPVETWPLPAALANADRVAARRAALLEFDPMVRRLLQGTLPGFAPRSVELTVYDAIYAASPEVGGHWTAAAALFGLFSHSVRSFSVALLFDDHDRPRRFLVSGARAIASADTSEAALSAALAEALAAGPAVSLAPHVFQSVGI